MANKAKWWRNKAANCEDAISRAITAKDGLAETSLWINAHLRRGSGDRENLEVALQIIDFAASIAQEYLDSLRAERKELNHEPNARGATRSIRGHAASHQGGHTTQRKHP